MKPTPGATRRKGHLTQALAVTPQTTASTRRVRALLLLHSRAPAPRSRSRSPATAGSAAVMLPSALRCVLCIEPTRPALSLRGVLLLGADQRTAGAVGIPPGLLAGAGSPWRLRWRLRWRLHWLEQLHVVLHVVLRGRLVVEGRRWLGKQTPADEERLSSRRQRQKRYQQRRRCLSAARCRRWTARPRARTPRARGPRGRAQPGGPGVCQTSGAAVAVRACGGAAAEGLGGTSAATAPGAAAAAAPDCSPRPKTRVVAGARDIAPPVLLLDAPPPPPPPPAPTRRAPTRRAFVHSKHGHPPAATAAAGSVVGRARAVVAVRPDLLLGLFAPPRVEPRRALHLQGLERPMAGALVGEVFGLGSAARTSARRHPPGDAPRTPASGPRSVFRLLRGCNNLRYTWQVTACELSKFTQV